MPARFEHQVRQHGSRLAVESAGAAYTYSQLNGLANDVAQALCMAAREASPYVAVLTDHGAMNLAGLLGVLKAGRAFVPLDPQWPEARMRWVLDHCDARIIVASRSHAPLARDVSGPSRQILVLEDLATETGRANPGVSIDADAPAYVLYTSGSTGRPKGVRHSHRALTHEVLRLTNALRVCADDRQSLLRANSGGAISDAFTALLNGATVCPIDVHEAGPDALASWVARERITIWRSTPSLFRAVWSALPATAPLPHLRIIFLCGEPVNGSDLEAWRTHASSNGLFVNCLGSTECATVTLYLCGTETPSEPGPVPLGNPVDDMDVDLVDEDGATVTGAGSGEIVVRSRYLADGYVDEPELTARSFRDDPVDAGGRLYLSGDIGERRDDGCLIYQGRKGARANLLGRTFELAEVEAALLSLPGIREAVAAVVADARGVSHLVAYVVSDQPAAPSAAALHVHARERLPSFMVPARFVDLDRIPLTPTGKADRRALPDPFTAGTAIPAPADAPPTSRASVIGSQTPTEAQLTGLWREALGVPVVRPGDNFFELGGHSLHALQLLDRIRRTFHVDESLREFVLAPTIADQVGRMRRGSAPTRDRGAQVELLRAPLDGLEAARPPLLVAPSLFGYVGEWRNLFRDVAFNRAEYGIELHERVEDAPAGPTLERIASEIVDLVTGRFSTTSLHVAGYSFGGLLAYELGQQLQGSPVGPASIVLVDTSADDPGGPFTLRDVSAMATNLPRWLVNELGVYGPRALWNRLIRRVGRRMSAPAASGAEPDVTDAEHLRVDELMPWFDWSSVPPAYRQRALQNYTAMVHYRSQPTQNRVVYLHSRVRNLVHRHRPDGGWGQLVPRELLHVCQIPGEHGSALHERWRSTFIATLQRALDAVDEDTRAASVGYRGGSGLASASSRTIRSSPVTSQ